jgi:hypothetical protein
MAAPRTLGLKIRPSFTALNWHRHPDTCPPPPNKQRACTSSLLLACRMLPYPYLACGIHLRSSRPHSTASRVVVWHQDAPRRNSYPGIHLRSSRPHCTASCVVVWHRNAPHRNSYPGIHLRSSRPHSTASCVVVWHRNAPHRSLYPTAPPAFPPWLCLHQIHLSRPSPDQSSSPASKHPASK